MIKNLTGLRFYMAFWVALYHVREATDITFFSNIINTGYFGVDVFFVLSGYILSYVYFDTFFKVMPTRKQILQFLKRRIARIYPLHLVTLVLAILYSIMLARYLQNDSVQYFNHILPQVLLIHAWGITDGIRWNFPSWSISAEWFAYLFIFPFSYFLYKKVGLTILSVISSIICLLVWLIVFNYFDNNIGLLLETGALRIIPEFLLGSCAFLFFRENPGRNQFIIISVFLLTVLTTSVVAQNFQYFFVGVVPIFIVLLHKGNFVLDKIFGSRIIVFLGEISYSLYMFHFFSRSINGIVHSNFFGDEHNSIIYFANYTGLTILFAVIGYYLIEMPGRKFINQRF